MKIQEMICPNCNGKIEMKRENNIKSVVCPYCGTWFMVDDGRKEITINKNVNINKKYTNEATIKKAELEDKKDKRATFVIVAMILISFAILGFMGIGEKIEEKIEEQKDIIALEEGKIQAGSYSDLIGQDYKTVKAHFEAAGFTNIELIDLKDSGLAIWENDKVETISIGGNLNFSSEDWFEPDTKVVISYH